MDFLLIKENSDIALIEEKNNEENGEHNKYSNDNMQRKIKRLINCRKKEKK